MTDYKFDYDEELPAVVYESSTGKVGARFAHMADAIVAVEDFFGPGWAAQDTDRHSRIPDDVNYVFWRGDGDEVKVNFAVRIRPDLWVDADWSRRTTAEIVKEYHEYGDGKGIKFLEERNE